MRKIDRVGQIFSRLTVIEFSGRFKRHSYWLCKCICGNIVKVSSSNLISKTSPTLSCGCLNKEHCGTRTHGMSGTVEHQAWQRMINRCYNPNYRKFYMWGGRGIRVCEKWRNSFMAFYKDLGPRPSIIHSLERINNDGNYTPKNCRWATPKEQRNNQRRCN